MARESLPRWLPLALLGLTVALVFHRLLLGEVLYWGLPSLQFYPWHEFAASEIRAGRLPLWNPYNGAGAPLLANYQSALLYPPHLLYVLFPSPWWMGGIGMLHLLWAGIGMWRFTGRLGLSTFGRGIATLAFPLSSTLIARFGTLPMIEVAAWLPWLLLVVDALVTGGRPLRAFLGLAVVAAMQLLAGHAQWTYYSLLLAGGYALWRIVVARRPALRLVPLALGIALGAGIAAAQLVPTAELQRLSQRADEVGEGFALNFSFSPVSLVTLFNPDFFGNPGDGSYVIGGAYFEVAAYLGALPAVLGIIGAAHFWLRRKNAPANSHPDLNVFFTLVAVVSLILAFGQFTPIYPFLYRAMPTFSLFQAPARWLLLTVFALAMLAALAADAWQPGRRTLRFARLVMVTAAGTAAVSLLSARFNSGLPPIALQIAQGIATLCGLMFVVGLLFALQPRDNQPQRRVRWMIAALLFLCVDLWWANSRSNPTTTADFYRPLDLPGQNGRTFQVENQTQARMFDEFLRFDDYRVAGERLESYRRSGLPNLNLLDRRHSLHNFDPLRPEWHERYIRLLNGAEARTVRAIARTGFVTQDSPDASTSERVWVAPRFQIAASPEVAEQMMRAPGWDALETAIIESAETLPFDDEGEGTPEIIAETPLELTLRVSGSKGGMLVLADTYYPGWQATVNGQPAPIYRANLAFRAVPVPPGESTVGVYYDPPSFKIGAAISALSLVTLSALALTALVTARRGLSRQST